MNEATRRILAETAEQHGTPCYVYFPQRALQTLEELEAELGSEFKSSFAIKSNPNVGLLRALRRTLTHVDASSIGEVDRALAAGYQPEHVSFSGPAKRNFEIDSAVRLGLGAIVCESEDQLAAVDAAARRQNRRASVLLRINPKSVPKKFGLSMAGRASQFGVDQEDCDALLGRIGAWKSLDFDGFHIFSGGNSLDPDALAENFEIMATLFCQFSERHKLRPRKLIFGAGFGIPYFGEDIPLDIGQIAPRITAEIRKLRRSLRLPSVECMLEMGRYLIGPHGYLLTTVVASKKSRGTEIRMCDAGFNNHLSACGMMGTVIRRNWKFANLTTTAKSGNEYLLVGPLCASFDQLAAKIWLPSTNIGDVIAVESSGAYGLTSSPTRFISHPEPREFLCFESPDPEIVEVSESLLNHGSDGSIPRS